MIFLFVICAFWKKLKQTGEIPFDKKLDLEIQELSKDAKKGGKSTLINSLFREELADTGVGRPVTQKITYYTKEDFPLSIYDIPGLELDPKTQKKLINDIFKIIKKQHSTKDPKKYIHCLWYCISCTSKRYEESEIEFIRKISNNPDLGNIPFFIIITQCYNENDKKQIIAKLKEENLGAREIIPVLAKEQIINIKGKNEIIPPYGLDTIVSLMKNYLPDFLQNTLDNIKVIAFKSLRLKARIAIGVATSAAFTVGGDFIPYTRVSFLLPIELSMLKFINYIYDVEVLNEYLDDFLQYALSATGIIGTKVDLLSNVQKKIESNPFVKKYFKPVFNDILIDDKNLYIESEKTRAKYRQKIQSDLQNMYDTVNINDLTDWFNNFKGNPKLAISTAAVTVAIGESYRKFVENYCIYHDKKSDSKIKKEIQSLFKSEMKKQNALYLNAKKINDL